MPRKKPCWRLLRCRDTRVDSGGPTGSVTSDDGRFCVIFLLLQRGQGRLLFEFFLGGGG